MPNWDDVNKIVKKEAGDVADGLRSARDRLDNELAKKEREMAATPQERMDMLLADIEEQNAATDALLAQVSGQPQTESTSTGDDTASSLEHADPTASAERSDDADPSGPASVERSDDADAAQSNAADAAQSDARESGGTDQRPSDDTGASEPSDSTGAANDDAPVAANTSPRAARPVSELQVEYEQRKAKADDLLEELRDELGITDPNEP